MPRIGLGVDFGTSNSAAAVFDGHRCALIQLQSNDMIVPTATYVERSYKTCTGQAAIDAYIADNTGRAVELVDRTMIELAREKLRESASIGKPVLCGAWTAADDDRTHVAVWTLAMAAEASVLVVLDRSLWKSDPSRHASKKAVTLGHEQQCIDHAPRHEPEVGASDRQVE
jgi:hypothetical protein